MASRTIEGWEGNLSSSKAPAFIRRGFELVAESPFFKEIKHVALLRAGKTESTYKA